MVIIGLLYLIFEVQLLRNSAALDGDNATAKSANPMSRIMIGIQVRPLIPHTTPFAPLPISPLQPRSTPHYRFYPAFSPQTNTR